MRQSLHVSLSEQLHQRTQCFVKHNDNTLGGGRLLQDRYSSNICRHRSDLWAQSHNQGPLDRLRWSADWRSRDNRSLLARTSLSPLRPSITSAGAHSCRPGRNYTSGATHRLLLITRSSVTDSCTGARHSTESTMFLVRRLELRDTINWLISYLKRKIVGFFLLFNRLN